MASQTDIANLALTKLGQSVITDITNDVTSARALLAVWDMERLSELRKFRWSFALARAALPALSTAQHGYTNAFQLPADYVSLIQVGDFYAVPSLSDYVNGDNSDWAIGGGQILTDLGAPLNIRYVKDVTDTGQFDPLFAQSLASRLAYVCCERITGSNQKRDAAAADYKEAILNALRINAIERAPMSDGDDSWVMGRL